LTGNRAGFVVVGGKGAGVVGGTKIVVVVVSLLRNGMSSQSKSKLSRVKAMQ